MPTKPYYPRYTNPPKPRPLTYARDLALLHLAIGILTGFEIHVMSRGERYAVIGDDAFSIVAVRGEAARCITCKPRAKCLCAQTVVLWRRRLKDLGANP